MFRICVAVSAGSASSCVVLLELGDFGMFHKPLRLLEVCLPNNEVLVGIRGRLRSWRVQYLLCEEDGNVCHGFLLLL